MGLFSQPLTVTNSQTGASLSVDAVVDTGATFTSVPAAQLESIGLRPLRTVPVTLADGSSRELPAGQAEMTVEGQTAICPCLFGPEGSPPRLGATTLEILLLAVDPVRRALVPTQAYLL